MLDLLKIDLFRAKEHIHCIILALIGQKCKNLLTLVCFKFEKKSPPCILGQSILRGGITFQGGKGVGSKGGAGTVVTPLWCTPDIPLYLIKIKKFWAPQGPFYQLKGGLEGPWHTNIMICAPMSFCIIGINFDIHHAYIPSFLIKSQFFGPPRALKPLYGGLGGPWHTNLMIWCVSMSFCILGINFDIQHAYIPSYLTKSQFLDPVGALGGALGLP